LADELTQREFPSAREKEFFIITTHLTIVGLSPVEIGSILMHQLKTVDFQPIFSEFVVSQN
jgi:hypothetical protein